MTTIQANLDSIKAAGFTTIQTSPMQPQKDYWAGNTSKDAWWKLYQPLGFSIATKNNALGTKTQLKSMVSAAHNKGLKVIVDVVANHFAGNHSNIPDELKGIVCKFLRSYAFEPSHTIKSFRNFLCGFLFYYYIIF